MVIEGEKVKRDLNGVEWTESDKFIDVLREGTNDKCLHVEHTVKDRQRRS